MTIEQIYTGCLAQGAYYIKSDGEAAVIDPLRESEPYLERAEKEGVKIKYIFETHFHADFVSGHLDLSQKTGAKIVYGPKAETAYEKHTATDGEEFKVGKVTIKVLHTPGHTPESTCYLLIDENGKEKAIFTGDTLFIGDVGRPDLAQKNTGLTKEDLAGWLFDSLRTKIMTLPDDVIVYPAHGAGSACGKNMSSETFDLLGNQKKNNYALRADMTRDEFIKEVTDGLMPPPNYFSANAMLNKKGYESVDIAMERGTKALSPKAFETVANSTDSIILDVRSKEEFVKGFIPNSIFIGLDGSFAPWVGALLPNLKHSILIVAPEGRAKEAVKRLARIGCDNVLGFLEGGFEVWKNKNREVDAIKTIYNDEFANIFKKDLNVLDVRKPGEFGSEHITSAQNFPLDFINKNMAEVNRDKEYFLHCRSGYRSTVAASILKSRGFEKLTNVQDKFAEMKGKIPTSEFVCSNS